MIYFTSDTHFGHAKIIQYCNRPFSSVEEMDAEMIRRWNEVVTSSDTVIHLGDFAITGKDKTREYRSRLNGRIILILGNHDRSQSSMLNCGFNEAHKSIILGQNGGDQGDYFLRHVPVLDDSWKAESACVRAHLCGHVHEKWKRIGDVINVGVDQWDFRPVTLKELLAC
jgi:calcineurin-like phosphoesterase family protein